MGWSTECITPHHHFSIIMIFTLWFAVKHSICPKPKYLCHSSQVSLKWNPLVLVMKLKHSFSPVQTSTHLLSPWSLLAARSKPETMQSLPWSCPWAHKPCWGAEDLRSDGSTTLRPLLLHQHWLTSRQVGERADQPWDHLHPSVWRHPHHC